jgi:hypothetical protein
MGDGNGKPALVEQGVNERRFAIRITYCPDKGEFQCDGLDIPPWISLGMLKYMEILVRRRDVENAMRAAVAQQPLIQRPGGFQ